MESNDLIISNSLLLQFLTSKHKHLVWRNYQFQHIYDAGQKLLQQAPEKKYALYLSTGYIYPEYRRLQVSSLYDYHVHFDLTDCVIYYATTFSSMNKRIQKLFPAYQPFDHVSYSEQQLVIDGRRCFQAFEHLGGITFYVDFLKDFVYKN